MLLWMRLLWKRMGLLWMVLQGRGGAACNTGVAAGKAPRHGGRIGDKVGVIVILAGGWKWRGRVVSVRGRGRPTTWVVVMMLP